VLGAPTTGVNIKSLGKSAGWLNTSIRQVQLLGSKEDVSWTQTDSALVIAPVSQLPNNFAVVFRIILN